MFINCSSKTLAHKLMSLIQDSTNLQHLLQLHSLLIKTSLDRNNFMVAKFLSKSSSFSLSTARSIFNAVPSPDTFIWNTLIRAYLNSQNTRECLSLFAQMRTREGVSTTDSFSLSLVLQACGRSLDELNSGRAINALLLKLGFGLDLYVRAALIEMYLGFGHMDGARRAFDEICDPDVVSCNVLLGGYARVGEMDLAREVFDEMPHRDLVSWNTMIHGYASAGEVGPKSLLEKNFETEIFSGGSMTGNHSNSGQHNEALRLFRDMQWANVVPDKVTLIGVLLACGGMGALGTGRTIHEYIHRNGFEIDLKLGTALVNMYAKCGDIDNSLEVFNCLREKDVFAWSSMIVGLAQHGLGNLALEYFARMINLRISPSDVTFIGVLSACSHLGLVDKGWQYFNSMSGIFGVSPKLDHYGCMVDILARAGQLEEARRLIINMPFAPDAIIWRALLGACRTHKNIELAEEAMVHLNQVEPGADGNYVLLSNIYSQAKVWDKVAHVRRKMRSENIRKGSGSSWIEIDCTVHEFVASDTSHLGLGEIHQMLATIADGVRHIGHRPIMT